MNVLQALGMFSSVTVVQKYAVRHTKLVYRNFRNMYLQAGLILIVVETGSKAVGKQL